MHSSYIPRAMLSLDVFLGALWNYDWYWNSLLALVPERYAQCMLSGATLKEKLHCFFKGRKVGATLKEMIDICFKGEQLTDMTTNTFKTKRICEQFCDLNLSTTRLVT